jgi:hypothetical protein
MVGGRAAAGGGSSRRGGVQVVRYWSDVGKGRGCKTAVRDGGWQEGKCWYQPAPCVSAGHGEQTASHMH